MTNLDRPVRRRTRDAYSVLRPKAEKIVVTLAPGDLLVFRKERGRQTWALSNFSFFTLFMMAPPLRARVSPLLWRTECGMSAGTNRPHGFGHRRTPVSLAGRKSDVC